MEDTVSEENLDLLRYNLLQMDETVGLVMEAARISLKPGDSKIKKEDGTLFYKLQKHSSYDAADHIKSLADVLHADDG